MEKTRKAVALSYDQERDNAPKVVAKGHGNIAERILEVARENNVPTYEDPDLTHLLDALELDTEIPAELYRAVAEVLVFIHRMNNEYNRR